MKPGKYDPEGEGREEGELQASTQEKISGNKRRSVVLRPLVCCDEARYQVPISLMKRSYLRYLHVLYFNDIGTHHFFFC